MKFGEKKCKKFKKKCTEGRRIYEILSYNQYNQLQICLTLQDKYNQESGQDADIYNFAKLM